MIKLFPSGVFVVEGQELQSSHPDFTPDSARKGTMAYQILSSHNTSGDPEYLTLKFDALASHDITYVGIIQTAIASGLKEFPLPYVLTNCHNSLCAVGGTINEDDHVFGLSAAKRFGGIYVPAHLAVIHQYMREMMSSCGSMILGSDSHTRYGALGTLAIGEGGGELAKQLLGQTYNLKRPEVVGVYLTGKPRLGVGPQDVALAIIGAVFKEGYVKNKIMEFIGDGIANLSVEYRSGIDVMTTETTCLSSIWQTDDLVRAYYSDHGRGEAYKGIKPNTVAYYDGLVYVDLNLIEPMIAMPFHPSNVFTLKTVIDHPKDVFNQIKRDAYGQIGKLAEKLDFEKMIVGGSVYVDQGIVAGCAGGTFDNIVEMSRILKGASTGNDAFSLSVYPSSQPTYLELMKNGTLTNLISAGAIVKTAFCGPCFGAGDVPAHQGFSIRHTTRNFPNREGSVPKDGQISSVALMDARSIAATAKHGGKLTSALNLALEEDKPIYQFSKELYEKRVYNGYGSIQQDVALVEGPNIVPWPELSPLPEHLILKVCAFIDDEVTTTDELIPSGETSSYRSNPLRLAEYTLSRKDPEYVGRAKKVDALSQALRNNEFQSDELKTVWHLEQLIQGILGSSYSNRSSLGLGSVIYALKPGDGSAREQAASCQKVLGGWANIARDYATKRYRTNLINWGILPLCLENEPTFEIGDYLFIPNLRKKLLAKETTVDVFVLKEDSAVHQMSLGDLEEQEIQILLAGSLINFYKSRI
jgi:aconitate hydratase